MNDKLSIMKRLITLMSTIIAATSILSAQKRWQHGEHSVIVAIADHQLADSFILSSAAKGQAIGIGYSFGRSSNGKKDNFSMEWSISKLENTQFNVRVNNFSFRYGQAFSLLRSRKGSFNSYWGYSIQAAPSFIKATNKDGSLSSWSTSNTIGIYQSAEYTKGRNKWVFDIHLPLMGLSSRPDETSSRNNTINGWLYDSYSNLFVTSWHNQKAMYASLEFNTAWNKKFRLLAGARYQYLSSNEFYTYRQTAMSLYAGFSWH
jgi:hypothetical protein